ncbi:hypothetical protein FRC08_014018, partial [Ceratobasidium sp. 394]
MEDPRDLNSSAAELDVERETPSPRVQGGEKITKRAEIDPAGQRTVSKYFAKEEKDVGSLGGNKMRGSAEFKAVGKDTGKPPRREVQVKEKLLGCGGSAPVKRRFEEQHSEGRPVPGEALEGTAVIDTLSSDNIEHSPARLASPHAVTRQTSRKSVETRVSNKGRKRRTELPSKEQLSDKELNESSGSAAPEPKAKKKRTKRGYAPPEVYAHLNFVQDCLDYELNILFCGINPGQKSAGEGHHFANPRNGFWKCLHQGGQSNQNHLHIYA